MGARRNGRKEGEKGDQEEKRGSLEKREGSGRKWGAGKMGRKQEVWGGSRDKGARGEGGRTGEKKRPPQCTSACTPRDTQMG